MWEGSVQELALACPDQVSLAQASEQGRAFSQVSILVWLGAGQASLE
jgi:hypothetical protein